jgi:hypothetical protein
MSKSALTFTIITLVTIIFWAIFQVISELQKTQLPDDIRNNAIYESTLPSDRFDNTYLSNLYKERIK